MSRPAWVDRMLQNPGLYSIGMMNDTSGMHTLVLSRDGKLYSMEIDTELSPDGFNEGAFIQKQLLVGPARSMAGLPSEEKLVRLKRGECLKCNAGPMLESCAYPGKCEHPGRELAKALNKVLMQLSMLSNVVRTGFEPPIFALVGADETFIKTVRRAIQNHDDAEKYHKGHIKGN